MGLTGEIFMEKTQERKKIAIAVLALIGLITTIKLCFIYYEANFNPYALASFCSVNEFIDCDGVAKTNESQFFGIPLAVWGLILYSFIFLMLTADKLKNFKLFKFMEVFKNPLDYIASLGLISFTISMILLCVSLFDIHKLCVLCAFTYIINFFIALVAADFKNGGFIKSFKQSFLDFWAAVKIKKYLVAFIIVVLAFASLLVYTSVSNVLTPQVKNSSQFNEFVKAKSNKYKVSGNILGDSDAKITVYVYSDYQCPICRAHNIMIHKLAHELRGIRIIHKNLPLDTECNGYLQSPFHEGSCMEARYALAAEKQGKFWDMNTALFDKKPKNEQEVLKLAEKLGLDIAKLREDAQSSEVSREIRDNIREAYSKGINGTPATVINGEASMGIKKYGEYKELLIKQGAEERK